MDAKLAAAELERRPNWSERFLALIAAPAGTARKKPATLAYGAEETPSAAVTWISAVQHLGVVAIFMVYPLIIARQAGASPDEITTILQLGTITLAVAVLLQALPRGPVGSRFLAPSIFTGVYLAPSLLAVKLGGLPLVWGMTMFAGVIEIALSRVWSRLRPFIPPESAGMVVFLVGLIIGLAAARILVEGRPDAAVGETDAIVAGLSFAVMTGLNIWNKGRLKLFCILIGMVAGYIAAAFAGLITLQDVHDVLSRPLIAVPSLKHLSWSFDLDLVVPFAVTALASAMSTTAVVTTYQRLTDAEWVRPDMASIGRGVLGDGIAAVFAGLTGTYGLTVSTANVGLVAATGVASRLIAFALAAVLLIVSLQPTLLGVLTIMPRPVMAAALLFTAVFIMIGGVQIVSSRVLDGRRTLVVGMGVMAFIVTSVYPHVFADAPGWAKPLVTSPLVLATITALLLNLVFRIGIRRSVRMSVVADQPDFEEVQRFIERNAGIWGARRDVARKVDFAVHEAIEAVVGTCAPRGAVALEVGYDEFAIDVTLQYVGAPLDLPTQAPSKDDILNSEDGQRRLAGFLVRRYADRTTASRAGDASLLRLHFEH